MYLSGELIVSRYVAESITTDAGRFGHVGLCQLRTKRAWPKHPASVVIDSATYLLTISSPDIDNVTMSLYDIVHVLVYCVYVSCVVCMQPSIQMLCVHGGGRMCCHKFPTLSSCSVYK